MIYIKVLYNYNYINNLYKLNFIIEVNGARIKYKNLI